MNIVILSGGLGARFATVGYEKPKPLLRVDGKTMLEHVVSMYPGEHSFILGCNEQIMESETVQTLKENLQHVQIVPIPAHTKGPVYSLSFVWHLLKDDEPVLVSYCDFKTRWDFNDFIKKVSTSDVDGAVPSYMGFHPHLLHKKKYAGVTANPEGIMEHIKEKHCFTENPEDCFQSAGNYYFSQAGDMKQYAKALMESGDTVNGEHYVSMIYYQYLADGKKVLVYPLTHFLQWGTPEDLEEYEAWSSLMLGKDKGVTDIPESRKQFIKIPYAADTRNYERSAVYWKEYFAHLK